jgi:AcrR family transcriptional regulator
MSPRTPQQFEEIREGKKSLIMDTALEHFAKNGYHTTTINHIAQRAGISKGLMYNYFKSKEDLLKAIIGRSLMEIYNYFDINRDGYLSEEEFEYFVRKISVVLKEKRTFWRLFFQLLMQEEVREQFLNSFLGTRSLLKSTTDFREGLFISGIMKIITEYFVRKKQKRGSDYDPYLDLNMFILTLKGFAITYIYMNNDEEEQYKRTIDMIIETYK